MYFREKIAKSSVWKNRQSFFSFWKTRETSHFGFRTKNWENPWNCWAEKNVACESSKLQFYALYYLRIFPYFTKLGKSRTTFWCSDQILDWISQEFTKKKICEIVWWKKIRQSLFTKLWHLDLTNFFYPLSLYGYILSSTLSIFEIFRFRCFSWFLNNLILRNKNLTIFFSELESAKIRIAVF